MLRRDAMKMLRNTLKGRFILPRKQNYNDSCRFWNGMIDLSSAITVRPPGAVGVGTAVSFARRHGIEIAGKGGGHKVEGNAVGDNGLTLDMSGTRSIHVTPSDRPAQADEIEKHKRYQETSQITHTAKRMKRRQ